MIAPDGLKEQVHAHWNKQACDTQVSRARKFSRQYFDDIENWRYSTFPEIFSFAQFTRFHNQKILEVGVGAGTDFIQWVRSGAKAYGMDLTEEAIEHVRKRLDIYELLAEEVRVADVENIPYPDNTFDLVYSWGVIHHTPNTKRALEEIIRVTRTGGEIKIMVYNRRSLTALYKYLLFGLFRGKPFTSVSWIFHNYQESSGTKAFTLQEMRDILSRYPVRIIDIKTITTYHDLLRHKPYPGLLRAIVYMLACLRGFDKIGFFMTVNLEKNS